MIQIVGIEKYSFKGDDGQAVDMVKLYLGESNSRVEGMRTLDPVNLSSSVFIRSNLTAADLSVGDHINIMYRKYRDTYKPYEISLA